MFGARDVYFRRSWNWYLQITEPPRHVTHLRYLRRKLSQAASSLILLLYTTFILPKLKYLSSVWETAYENVIKLREKRQNCSAHFIFYNNRRTASVTNMKDITAITPEETVSTLFFFLSQIVLPGPIFTFYIHSVSAIDFIAHRRSLK